jgi:hypothetical protein
MPNGKTGGVQVPEGILPPDKTGGFQITDAALALLFPPLMGISTAASIAGVEGRNQHGGPGVTGAAPNGIGVLGKGGHLAGKFEGNVEVTGTLSIGGKDFQSVIQSLLQQIDSLEQRVATIENPPPPPTPKKPTPHGGGKGPR